LLILLALLGASAADAQARLKRGPISCRADHFVLASDDGHKLVVTGYWAGKWVETGGPKAGEVEQTIVLRDLFNGKPTYVAILPQLYATGPAVTSSEKMPSKRVLRTKVQRATPIIPSSRLVFTVWAGPMSGTGAWQPIACRRPY
jgi:hypothetical protein